ncbi:MAG TPA: tetratricopeptide repeat protein, partial [Longimicrobium sp.]|nr:tetratricopeptide repeat protein [Longimicrobium sp.]
NESLRTLTLSRQELEKSFFELELSRFARSEPESDDASVERAARAAADARARKLSQRVLFGTVAAGLVATVLLFLLFPVGRPAKPRAGESARGGSLVDVLWPGKDAAPEPAPVKQEEPEEALDPSGPTLEDGIRLYESGRPREAARVLSKVVVARPVNATAWLMLGIARFDSGDARGAEDAAKRALTLDPRNGRAIMLLASVYLADGQRELAHQQLRDYLELEPNGQYAHDARELLKQ